MLESILSSGLTIETFIICLLLSLALGFATSLVFSYKQRQSSSLLLTITILPAAICMVIMLVNGSIGTGIAIAGAFTLVRFRSVPGNAREIAAIFIVMTLGLACGTGYIYLALIFFLIIAAVVLLLSNAWFTKSKENERILKVTIPENLDYEGIFDDVMKRYTKAFSLTRVKTTNMGTMYELEYRVEMKTVDNLKAFMDELRCRNGNLNISILQLSEAETL